MNQAAAINTPEFKLKRVFVVGCARSGTTWTMLLLNQHIAVAGCTSTYLFSFLSNLAHLWRGNNRYWGSSIVSFTGDGKEYESTESRSPKVVLNNILSQEEFYELCRVFAAKVYDKIASFKPDAHVVVDQSPDHLSVAEFILKIFPDAYFIHVIRDPRSVVCSLRSASGQEWGKGLPSSLIDATRMWCSRVAAARQISHYTSRYRELRYEALLEDGPAQLEQILSWFDLPSNPLFCEKAVEACAIEKLRRHSLGTLSGFFRKGVAEGWREELSSAELRIVEYIARDLMEQLGYECISGNLSRKPLRLWLYDGLCRIERGVRRRLRALRP